MAALMYPIYEFDEFQLDPRERRLLRQGRLVPLHAKAFELLLALIRKRGQLLTKDEIFGLVWPDQIVEESNLTVNMSAIRRALGERPGNPRYITTVSGRGYRFSGEVRELADELTIERESFTRLVVEQEEFDSEAPAVVMPVPEHRTAAIWLRMSLVFVLGGVFVLTAASASPWLYRTLHRQAAAASLSSQTLSMRHFATHGGVPFRAVISPDGKSIVYRQRINGKDSLWLGEIDSNGSVLISEQPGLSYASLTLSPDGSSIYVTVHDQKSAKTKLMRMPIVGGVMTEIVSNIDSAPACSPDGRQLAFLRRNQETEQTSIVIVDNDGKNERLLVTRSPQNNFFSEGLSWAPDGKTIAVGAKEEGNGHSEILGVSIADGSVRTIGKRDWGAIGNLAWLPDGTGLVLSAVESAVTRRLQIWSVSYPNGEVRQLTNDLDMYVPESISVAVDGTVAVLLGHDTYEIWVAPGGDTKRAHLVLQGVEPRYEGVDGLAWAADGSVIYSAYAGDSQAIWKINGDGGNLRQLTSNGANFVDRQTRATADGRYLVFQSNRSGNFQIWRANADGTNLRELTSDGNNYQPCPSPDSQWVVYTSEREGRSSLWRVSINGGQATRLTDRVSSWPEISPDGKYIAYLEVFDSARRRLAIMPFAGGDAVKTFAFPDTVYLPRRPSWTPDGRALMYKDSVQGIWRQPLDEEKPQPVKGFEDLAVSQFAWSLDGKNLVYNRGAIMRDIVLLRNSK